MRGRACRSKGEEREVTVLSATHSSEVISEVHAEDDYILTQEDDTEAMLA